MPSLRRLPDELPRDRQDPPHAEAERGPGGPGARRRPVRPFAFRKELSLGGFVRKAALLLVALGLFSLVFSLLAERGLWPQLPAGALHGSDLAAGFAVGAGLI